MNAILGYAELVDEESDLQAVKEYVRRIRVASVNLLGVINDILDFSANEFGKLKLKAAPFALVDVINQLKIVIDPKSQAKGVPLKIEIDSTIPPNLVGDSQRLTQVLLNLISNAVKFTNSGEVKLSISVVKDDLKNVDLKFSVIDTGLGIEDKELSTLFKPFSQTDSAEHTKERGTGLGLKIAQDLVNLMGGVIRVQSVVGKGSEFYFTIPFTKG